MPDPDIFESPNESRVVEILDRLAIQLQTPQEDAARMATFSNAAVNLAAASVGDPIVRATFFASIANFERARGTYLNLVEVVAMKESAVLLQIELTAIRELLASPGQGM